jgi:hypothetical protein
MHQCGDVVMTSSDDVSGDYRRLNRSTLYCAGRSLFLDIGRMEAVRLKALLNGRPVRLSAERFS